MKVLEMRMGRWMCDVTQMDRIRNEYIKGSLGVTNIAKKMKQNSLRWFGHVKEEIKTIQ